MSNEVDEFGGPIENRRIPEEAKGGTSGVGNNHDTNIALIDSIDEFMESEGLEEYKTPGLP